MSSRPYGFCQQQGLEANSASCIQSSAPRRELQCLDSRGNDRLDQGIAHSQLLCVGVHVGRFAGNTIPFVPFSSADPDEFG